MAKLSRIFYGDLLHWKTATELGASALPAWPLLAEPATREISRGPSGEAGPSGAQSAAPGSNG